MPEENGLNDTTERRPFSSSLLLLLFFSSLITPKRFNLCSLVGVLVVRSEWLDESYIKRE